MPLFRPLWSPRRPRPCRAPPRLEVLEDRFAPAGFTVDSALSGNFGSHLNGTLSYCIAQANALSGSDTIRFDSTVFGTASGQVRGITLDAALPVMTDHLTIQGLPDLRV